MYISCFLVSLYDFYVELLWILNIHQQFLYNVCKIPYYPLLVSSIGLCS